VSEATITDEYFLPTVMGDQDAHVLARLALAAARPLVLEEETRYAVRDFNGDVKVIDGPYERTAPLRTKGTCRLYDATSFGAYFHKHNEGPASQIYADPYGPAIVALLNGNGPTPDADTDQVLGFGDHRASLIFRHTPAWERWSKLDGQMVDQVRFALHIEDSLPEIIEPDGATMLELAESFQAATKVKFESGTDLGSGQRQLTYHEEINAQAGRKGNLVIPKTFTIGVAPFEGCAPYRVEARLRYRIREGALSLGYQLDRPEDVLRNAFDDVLRQVQDATGVVALLGTPPA
jgi:uncharacterized protein YfdQ (DUF2303 family)